jgi:hypothetical protein
MKLFTSKPAQTEPPKDNLERLQAELRDARAFGESQDGEIRQLEGSSVFRSTTASLAEFTAARDQLELLRARRQHNRESERDLQAAIDATLQIATDQRDLDAAVAEETIAAEQAREASLLCKALDTEHRSWESRRNTAYKQFCTAAQRHQAAKARLEHLSSQSKSVVRPLVVAMN